MQAPNDLQSQGGTLKTTRAFGEPWKGWRTAQLWPVFVLGASCCPIHFLKNTPPKSGFLREICLRLTPNSSNLSTAFRPNRAEGCIQRVGCQALQTFPIHAVDRVSWKAAGWLPCSGARAGTEGSTGSSPRLVLYVQSVRCLGTPLLTVPSASSSCQLARKRPLWSRGLGESCFPSATGWFVSSGPCTAGIRFCLLESSEDNLWPVSIARRASKPVLCVPVSFLASSDLSNFCFPFVTLHMTMFSHFYSPVYQVKKYVKCFLK